MPPSRATWRRRGDFFRDERLEAAGVAHGVTTRPLGDMREARRRRAALESAGVAGGEALWLKQVHGDRVVPLESAGQAEGSEADGWVSRRPASRPVCVFIADCAPLYLWDQSRGAAGVFHVGWRGAHAGMPARAVAAFRSYYGVEAALLEASIGPHIGPCCFRVGLDVAARFRPESVIAAGQERRLDLGAEIAAQLADAGVPASSVGESRECTSCLNDLFYSYRKERRASAPRAPQECMMAFLG